MLERMARRARCSSITPSRFPSALSRSQDSVVVVPVGRWRSREVTNTFWCSTPSQGRLHSPTLDSPYESLEPLEASGRKPYVTQADGR